VPAQELGSAGDRAPRRAERRTWTRCCRQRPCSSMSPRACWPSTRTWWTSLAPRMRSRSAASSWPRATRRRAHAHAPPRLSLGVGRPHPQVCLFTLLSKASWQRGAPPLRSGRAKLQCRPHEGPSPAACMESGSMQISLCSSVVPRWRCMRCTGWVRSGGTRLRAPQARAAAAPRATPSASFDREREPKPPALHRRPPSA